MQLVCAGLPYESCTILKVLIRAAPRCQGRHQMGCQLNYIQWAALLKFSLLLVSMIKLAVWLHLHVPVNSLAAHSCCCFAGQSGFSLSVIWRSVRAGTGGHET